LSEAIGTAAPVRDLRLVDFVAVVVGGFETRRLADGAVDVDDAAAQTANQ
jgi:hypothetical protein